MTRDARKKRAAYQKLWREQNKERLAAYRKWYRLTNGAQLRERDLEYRAKNLPRVYANSARRRNIEWELTVERVWWLVSKRCIYCGKKEAGGIDRVKNSFGYTVLNSVPCCTNCNYAKRTLSAPDYIAHSVAVTDFTKTYQRFKPRWVRTRTSGPGLEGKGKTR